MSLQLSPHFSLHEMMRSNAAERNNVDNRATANEINRLVLLARYMEQVRTLFRQPIIVTSAFRSREINKLVGGAVNSDHVAGYAIDFKMSNFTPQEICDTIANNGFKYHQLINEFNSWVHLSINPALRNQDLIAQKINGRTVYKQVKFGT